MIERIYDRQSVTAVSRRFVKSTRPLVIGVGGIGTWVAIFFAMAGVEELILVDPDVVEIHNLNRLPFTLDAVGKPKVEVVKEFIKKIRPNCLVFTYQKRFEEVEQTLLIHDPSVVISTVDDLKTMNEVRKWCEKHKLLLIEANYDYRGDQNDWAFSIVKSSPSNINKLSRWDFEVGEGGYRVIPSYVVPAVLVASLVVHIALHPEFDLYSFIIPSTVIKDLIKQLIIKIA